MLFTEKTYELLTASAMEVVEKLENFIPGHYTEPWDPTDISGCSETYHITFEVGDYDDGNQVYVYLQAITDDITDEVTYRLRCDDVAAFKTIFETTTYEKFKSYVEKGFEPLVEKINIDLNQWYGCSKFNCCTYTGWENEKPLWTAKVVRGE